MIQMLMGSTILSDAMYTGMFAMIEALDARDEAVKRVEIGRDLVGQLISMGIHPTQADILVGQMLSKPLTADELCMTAAELRAGVIDMERFAYDHAPEGDRQNAVIAAIYDNALQGTDAGVVPRQQGKRDAWGKTLTLHPQKPGRGR